jgi:hypothetical protein
MGAICTYRKKFFLLFSSIDPSFHQILKLNLLNDFDIFQIIENTFMGTGNRAESVKLSKMQVTMNKTRSLDGISAHWRTCNLIPATCVTFI